MMFHEAMNMAQIKRLIALNPTDGVVVPKNNYKEMKKALNDTKVQPSCDIMYNEIENIIKNK